MACAPVVHLGQSLASSIDQPRVYRSHACICGVLYGDVSFIPEDLVPVCIVSILHPGLSKIEDLQSHENEQIYCLAAKLIDMYFEVEETVSSSDALPQGQVAGPEHVSSSMNFVVNSNGTPEGGFKF